METTNKVNSLTLELHHVKEEGSLLWVIRDFLAWSMLRKDDPCYVTNPVQIKLGNQILHFKLHLELNTRKDDDIGLYLTSENKQELKVQFKLVALDLNNTAFESHEITNIFDDTNPTWGDDKFLSKKKISANQKRFLPGGSLTVRCDIVLFKSENMSVKNNWDFSANSSSTLDRDLKAMWTERKFANFIVVCGDKQFRCHKNILAFRSDVFKAMLNHKNSLEAMTNRLKIEDCKPEFVEKLLEFLYTDHLEDPKGYNSVDLLYLADKYQVESLKISCTTELARLIDCSNAVHRLLFATQISCLDLVSAAAKFIARHRQEFFDTKVWKDAIEDNPEVMEAILKFGFE